MRAQKNTGRVVHLRVWSNNPRDIDTACGLFARLGDSDIRWEHWLPRVTCPACKRWAREHSYPRSCG